MHQRIIVALVSNFTHETGACLEGMTEQDGADRMRPKQLLLAAGLVAAVGIVAWAGRAGRDGPLDDGRGAASQGAGREGGQQALLGARRRRGGRRGALSRDDHRHPCHRQPALRRVGADRLGDRRAHRGDRLHGRGQRRGGRRAHQARRRPGAGRARRRQGTLRFRSGGIRSVPRSSPATSTPP